MKTNSTIDEYIKSYPNDVQKILQEFRAIILKAESNLEEAMAYG